MSCIDARVADSIEWHCWLEMDLIVFLTSQISPAEQIRLYSSIVRSNVPLYVLEETLLAPTVQQLRHHELKGGRTHVISCNDWHRFKICYPATDNPCGWSMTHLFFPTIEPLNVCFVLFLFPILNI